MRDRARGGVVGASWRALLAFVVVAQSCAGVDCVINTDCGERALCSSGRCVRECLQDRDCGDGMACDVNGQCRAATDAGADVAKPDDASTEDDVVTVDVPTVDRAAQPDVVTVDRAVTDVPVVDVPAMDVPVSDVPVIDRPVVDVPVTDVPVADVPVTDVPAVDRVVVDVPAVDAGGPVAAGVYEFTGVRPETLVTPTAVAWHPAGDHALLLAYTDEVWRYDVATNTVRRVAGAGRDVAWRALTFTPDGARALLFGNSGSGTSARGRMFVWDVSAGTLTERADAAVTATVEAVRFAPDGSRAAVLSHTSTVTTVRFVDATGAATGTPAARGMVSNTACNDLAWVSDGFGDPAIAIACGINTGGILQLTGLTSTARFTELAGASSTGNVSHVTARPQGDVALAIGSSSSPPRIYRYRGGSWSTGFSSPGAVSGFGVAFSDDGARALIFGGFGVLTEYRHDLYAMAELTEARIDLAGPPWAQGTGARVYDLAWRPGCDEGLVVGGENSLSRTSAFIVRFRALNGRRCP